MISQFRQLYEFMIRANYIGYRRNLRKNYGHKKRSLYSYKYSKLSRLNKQLVLALYHLDSFLSSVEILYTFQLTEISID